MSEFAIQVDGLGKQYRLGGPRARVDTLSELISSLAQNPLRYFKEKDMTRSKRKFWALQDITFNVRHGEVLGIIGRNGAGKSTLLKILARVTYPTVGLARINGKVGSLLEVGTGFHPELTGRENIFLNGAVLGMKRAETERKFNDIVEFAEIDKFLDTPVKRYSSGMYMRLAFSIAAHLEPEILIVDEVLAVGDAAFQRKCLGKMENVAREGRTVLFVSHNMPAVLSLCTSAIFLDAGRMVDQGTPTKIVEHYLDDVMSSSIIPLAKRVDRSGDGSVKLVSMQIESTDPDRAIRSGSRLKITVSYISGRSVTRPQFVITITDQLNNGIYLLHNDFVGGLPETLPPSGSVTCLTDPINLTSGRCYVHLELLKGNVRADLIHFAGSFDVEADDVFGTGMYPPREWVMGILGHNWWLNEG